MCDALSNAFVGFCENLNNIPNQINSWKVWLYMKETPEIQLEHFSYILKFFKRTNTVKNELYFKIQSKSSHLKYYLFFLAANTEGHEEMKVKFNEAFDDYQGFFKKIKTD